MNPHRRIALLTSLLALALAAPSARAAVFNVPPITIYSLTHQIISGTTRDGIFIPGPGYTSGGFTSDFATGDVVRVRVQAPAGRLFRVHAPAGGTSLSYNLYWVCTGGLSTHFNSATLAFENLQGTAPAATYQLTLANELVVEAWFDFTASADFDFTAFVVNIAVDQPLARTMRTYGDVASYSTPGILATGFSPDPNFRAMEIVDANPVPVHARSWGRIKALYR